MPMNKNITLPLWLDDLIFGKYGAVYELRPEEVQYNPDKDSGFVKIYLGTYFPRSYAEGYCIVGQLLDNPHYPEAFKSTEEINILDFCCGTGGEIFGICDMLLERLPWIKSINIDAFDANVHAIRILNKLAIDVKEHFKDRAAIRVNPQCIRINGDINLNDIINHIKGNLNGGYQFIISFKALNEFIQSATFTDENIYCKIADLFLPFLSDDGAIIISDLTHKKCGGIYYPTIMNSGLNRLLKDRTDFRTVYPYPCYSHESKCGGCYMQDIITVSHSRIKDHDLTKIAYRAICHKDFASSIMAGINPGTCRAVTPNAPKNIPYTASQNSRQHRQ